MRPIQPSVFGSFLKQYRLAANLAQETLAEQSGVSADAISMLERGTRQSPRPDTIRLLAEALHLSEQQHAELVAAAPRHRRPRDASGRDASRDAHDPAIALAALFPPTQALPVPLVDPIGRDRELDAVTALHAAHAARDAFPDGLAYLPLAALPDPAALAAAHACLLDVRDRGGQALPETTIDDLQGKRRLLLLDNYELIAAAAPLLVDLCAVCPDLTILVASRVALHVRGATEITVPPLALPDPAPLPAVAELAQYPAVRLFVTRAQDARPGFALTEANAGAISALCHGLDGLPLALELAAAHVRMLPPSDLLARLEQQPDILAHGPCDLPPRQRTMDACLDWSYDLLPPMARAVFHRLAAYADGCTFDAAASVCADIDAASEPAARVGDIFGHLTMLVDSHLLVMEQDGDVQRLTMPALVRAYALRQLRCSGERGDDTMTLSPFDAIAEVTARPNAARIYDYWLGGFHNFAIDRDAANAARAACPDIALMARANRAFLRRVVAYMLAHGVDQFLDIGSGLPTRGNVHELVEQFNPKARVVYVDNDGVAVGHSRVLLKRVPTAAAIQADARDPAAILAHPDTQRLLDVTRPLGVLLFAVPHFLPDDAAYSLGRALRETVAPGSLLALSHGVSEPLSQETLAGVGAVYTRSSTAAYMRSRAQIEAFFTGLDPLPPGIVYLPLWRPGDRDDRDEGIFLDEPERAALLGGVGQKP